MDVIEKDGKTYTYFRLLSEETGYDTEYLRKLAKAAKVDAIRVGSSWMINRASLEEYQAAQKNRHPHAD